MRFGIGMQEFSRYKSGWKKITEMLVQGAKNVLKADLVIDEILFNNEKILTN